MFGSNERWILGICKEKINTDRNAEGIPADSSRKADNTNTTCRMNKYAHKIYE